MRKSWIIMAAGAAFGLAAPGVGNCAEQISLNFTKIQLDATHSAEACTGQGGSVVTDHGQRVCQLPDQGGAHGVWKAPAGSAAPAGLKVKLHDIVITSVKTDDAPVKPK